MTIRVIDEEHGIETALNLDTIIYNEKTNICTFETLRGRKGKIVRHGKKTKTNDFVDTALENGFTYGEVIWEE